MTKNALKVQSTVKKETIHLPGHFIIKEPQLSFSCTDQNARDAHPLIGLSRYGPFSSSQIAGIPNPIRIALIAPFGRTEELKRFINELNSQHSPTEKKDYLVDYPGFSQVFKTNLVCANEIACIELPQDLDNKINASSISHTVLADAVTQALHTLSNVQHEYSIVLVLLPNRWEKAFYKKTEDEDFNLHHFIKAISASKTIPVQVVNDDDNSALRYKHRCSVMWRMSIALYAKAGGTPWTWADSPPDTAYIGLRYALINKKGATNRFAICCSQVFDADGAGLEFVAYEADDVRLFGKNPFLSRSQMLSVISRSISIYQRKHYGKKPKNVVIHKNTEFKEDEIDGCFDALKSIENVDLIHVKQETPWNAIHVSTDRNRKVQIDGYPCIRGTSLQLGGNDSLLWVHGNSTSLGTNRSYYKGGKGIPQPLQLVRYAGHGSMDEIGRSIIALSKMDWNNDGPYTQLPVTLSYAHTMAEIVAKMPKLESRPYPIRFFI